MMPTEIQVVFLNEHIQESLLQHYHLVGLGQAMLAKRILLLRLVLY